MRPGDAAKASKALGVLAERDQRTAERTRIQVSKAVLARDAKALKAQAKAKLSHLRQRAIDLRVSLRTASAAARELAKYIQPGARVLITREQREALDLLAKEHARISHVTMGVARLTPSGAVHTRQRTTAAERAHESDDEVRANLEPEQLPAFEKWKGKVKATARMSRTEAFLQLVHDNPSGAAQLYYDAAEAAAERQWKRGAR